jgi:O-antigen ligase
VTYLLLAICCLLLAFLAWKNFRLAVGIFIIGLPAYLIRFKLGPLPSTILELNFGILFLVWLIKFARSDLAHLKSQIKNHKYFFNILLIFFISSVISIFISDMWYYSLGQWRAYFLEPMLVFVMLAGRTKNNGTIEQLNNRLTPTDLIWFLTLSTISISLFGILQYFTGWHIGNVDWIALQTHRVTSFFLSPNAVGLYLGPLVPLMLGVIARSAATKQSLGLGITQNKGIATPRYARLAMTLVTALALVTLLLTKSLGTLIAVAIGTLLFLFLIGRKKTALAIIVGALLLSPFTFHLINNKSQSMANRATLWSYTQTFLTASPKNFVFGTGIRQFFRKIQKPYYDVKKMERLIYPHNIFLNFWTEIGLIGMASFIAMCYVLCVTCYKIYKHSNKILGASLLAALVVFLVHGLIDVPYFKNDLAVAFWIIAAIIVSTKTEITARTSG